MSTTNGNKKFYTKQDGLEEMLEFLSFHVNALGFPPCLAANIKLAIEEALTNIITYSGLDQKQMLEMTCSASEHNKGILIEIKDFGVPFNPLKNIKLGENHVPLEKRKVGGYGIYLMTCMMDVVEYQRVDDCNLLRLIKYIP